MLYQNQLIDLLDRRFRLVNDLPARDFLLELENFVNFVQANEQLKPFADHLITRLQKTAADFNLGKGQLIRDLQNLRQHLVAKLPQVDDSDLPLPDTTHTTDSLDRYYQSLAHFGAVAQKSLQEITERRINRRDDDSILSLIQILQEKLDRELLGEEDYEYFQMQLSDLLNRDVYLRRKVQNYFRSSPEAALHTLYHLVGHINPEPARYHRRLAMDVEDERTRIQEVVYEGKEDEDLIRQCRVGTCQAIETTGLRI